MFSTNESAVSGKVWTNERSPLCLVGRMARLCRTTMAAMERLPAQSVPALVRWERMERKRKTAELLANPEEQTVISQTQHCHLLPLYINIKQALTVQCSLFMNHSLFVKTVWNVTESLSIQLSSIVITCRAD